MEAHPSNRIVSMCISKSIVTSVRSITITAKKLKRKHAESDFSTIFLFVSAPEDELEPIIWSSISPFSLPVHSVLSLAHKRRTDRLGVAGGLREWKRSMRRPAPWNRTKHENLFSVIGYDI